MKKLLLTLLVLVCACGVVYAVTDTTPTSTLTPKSGKLDYMSGGAVTVTDQSTGYTQKVFGEGQALVQEAPKTIAQANGASLEAGEALVSSACRVHTITVSSNTSAAGDTLLIYDNTSATGTAKFDITVGTAKETTTIEIPGGAIFSTGVFADALDDNMWLTITYDI